MAISAYKIIVADSRDKLEALVITYAGAVIEGDMTALGRPFESTDGKWCQAIVVTPPDTP